MSASAPPTADRVTLEFPAGEGYRSVGRLVLGGIASRFELPVDRVEDLLLAAESLFLQELAAPSLTLEAETSRHGLLVRMGPFASPVLADPGVRRVLERLTDELSERSDGAGAWVELLVAAAYRSDDG